MNVSFGEQLFYLIIIVIIAVIILSIFDIFCVIEDFKHFVNIILWSLGKTDFYKII